MTINIHQLSEKRKKWVEANRENGFEDGIKRLLTDLYPDNAHFIYELLQNAEDARATEVRFILKNDGVEFEHNGDRLFSIEDIDSITSIGVSTKKDDPTNIGKHGVGFKAVFSYTMTPEIESGVFHFRIIEMVVPDVDGFSPPNGEKTETRFVFPFDNPRKPFEKARTEIEKNLLYLDESTLLFLSNIRKIEYLLPDATLGFLERLKPDGNRIEIFIKHPDDLEPTSAYFLRFEKIVNVRDEDAKLKSCRIAAAFGLEKIREQDAENSNIQGEHHSNSKWKIKPLVPGQVSIYFPADKETSNLRFHIHAPFASTVARDSVRNCQANNELRDHLANLIAESMTIIREQGLLTIGFLSTLPNDKDNLSSFYKPIQNSLRKAFQNENLTPMKQGGFAAASEIFRGPAQLSNLISDNDLATILGQDFFPPLWVANPSQRNQREDNFLSMLNISEWTTESLINALSDQSETIIKWLAQKTDDWHQQLYAVLGDFLSNAPTYEEQSRKKKLAGLRIVRISDGTYSIGSKSYFPNEGVEHDDLMPRVSKGVYTSGRNEQQQKKAKTFLLDIGVREVGEAEQVEAILKDRYSQAAVDSKAFKPQIEDIKKFVILMEKESLIAEMFKDYYIFKLVDGKWGKPSSVYLDSPFLDTGLTAYYGVLENKDSIKPLSREYESVGVDIQKILKFAMDIGVKTQLSRIEDVEPLLDNLTGDQKSSMDLATLIWRTLCELGKKDRNILEDSYQYHKGWGHYGRKYYEKAICSKLKNTSWVPQIKNNSVYFVTPPLSEQKLLPEGLEFDSRWNWLSILQFGDMKEIERQAQIEKTIEYQCYEKAANDLGFDSFEEAREMAALKKKDPAGFKKWQESNSEHTKFPTSIAVNPKLRQERLIEQLADATKKSYEDRGRSVRTTRGTIDPYLWLREQYTNEYGQMVCQVCKNEMPFKKRDGEYYFEKVEAFSGDYFPVEKEEQFLALCPLCAAMYKVFIKEDKEAMANLTNMILTTNELEIPLCLGSLNTSIQFVEKHFFDLKTILLVK